jgi:hypothetical protein
LDLVRAMAKRGDDMALHWGIKVGVPGGHEPHHLVAASIRSGPNRRVVWVGPTGRPSG